MHTWKATADETAGAFQVFEDRMEWGKRTPLHSHPDSDETMYVLEGEILMHMDGQDHRIGVGGLAVAPRGMPHAFLVLSETARLLCLHTWKATANETAGAFLLFEDRMERGKRTPLHSHPDPTRPCTCSRGRS